MKRTFFIGFSITLILLGVAAWQVQRLITDLSDLHPETQTQLKPTVEVVPTDEPERQSILFGGVRYAYTLTIADTSTLRLVANFTRPTSASTLAQNVGCHRAINAGFYTKESKPLGLWDNGTDKLGTYITSDLVNTVIAKKGSLLSMTAAPPEDADFAFQTGPRLITTSTPHVLQIHNDEGARRSVAAISGDSQSIFLSIFRQGSLFDGPKLADLPDVLVAIAKKESLVIRDAVNLDGGNASFYKDPTRTISELTPVGSLMCETK